MPPTPSSNLLFALGDDPYAPVEDREEILLPVGISLQLDIASGGCWYGHGFAHRQPYPLNAEPIVNDAFAVNNTQSPIWLCSAGCAILADTNEMLSVRFNQEDSGCLTLRCDTAQVRVLLFHGADAVEAHHALMRHIGWPNTAPDPSFFGDSIFCTWTQYPRCITQQRILDMARFIREQGYPCSCITIDDRWESCFGELQFSADFPDPKGMIDALHDMGFRVLLWVTPFINQESAHFNELADQGFLVRSRNGSGAAMLRWWGGTAGLVDLTNPAGRAWYRDQLLRLKNEIGVDGFKIDGGDAKYQPPVAESAWHDYRGASGYADAMLELFEEIAPNLCETRTVWMSQRRRILWRQGGKDSHWGIDNGLPAMVTLALHTSLMGYDIIIPDMIPGRVQTMVSDLPLPSDELMIRWTEASAFMPIMQFSYFPWNYAEPTASAVLQYARLHKVMQAYIAESAENRERPLLRPLWYDHSDIRELYSVPDEFFLGPDLLAAPVVREGQVARDVILPPGNWRDAWTGTVCEGGLLLQHPAPCPGIPLFVRDGNTALFDTIHPLLAEIRQGCIASGITTATYRAGLDRDLSVTG